MVAMLRALADSGVTHVRNFSDPTAKRFLTGFWRRSFERAEQKGKIGKLNPAAREGAELLALRTMEIDARLRSAVEGGTRQMVTLGAGFDGRAFRMGELADVEVYEVDHPATQSHKRELSTGLPVKARSLSFVAVDFERESLAGALEKSGHRATELTVWIWEGVVMYLSDDALRSTLRVIATRSTPGSTLVIQYNTPGQDPLLKRLLLRMWGEPQIGLRSPERMATELAAVGFAVVADEGTADWAERFGLTMPHRFGESLRARIVTAGR
jgi:methyltransferase (TIGR00027 family)